MDVVDTPKKEIQNMNVTELTEKNYQNNKNSCANSCA